MWAQIFGLVLQPLKQVCEAIFQVDVLVKTHTQREFNFTGAQESNISICFSAGLTAGAAFWGILVDLIGS